MKTGRKKASTTKRKQISINETLAKALEKEKMAEEKWHVAMKKLRAIQKSVQVAIAAIKKEFSKRLEQVEKLALEKAIVMMKNHSKKNPAKTASRKALAVRKKGRSKK